MSIAYFKRFRMEVSLEDLPLVPELLMGYFWVPWDDSLLELHAEVHFQSFSDEIDSTLFPSFGDRFGCRHLLQEICTRPGFLPEATWLVACAESCCGGVQGVSDTNGIGAIQNVGIIPGHRHRGLGKALILQALHGFQLHGLTRAYLEVTAENVGALRLYQHLGFRRMKTVYKAVDA